MGNKIYLIILVCFFSCKKATKKEIAFFPNINILVSDLKDYEKIKIGGLSYQKRDKDTLTTYGFCSYLKTTCDVDWEVFFAKKDSLKIFDLLEKKGIQAFNSYTRRWLTEVRYDTAYNLKGDRNILYRCGFEDYGDSSSIILSHRITLYDKDLDFKVNHHPSYYSVDDTFEIIQNNLNENK